MLDVDICGPSIPKIMGVETEEVSSLTFAKKKKKWMFTSLFILTLCFFEGSPKRIWLVSCGMSFVHFLFGPLLVCFVFLLTHTHTHTHTRCLETVRRRQPRSDERRVPSQQSERRCDLARTEEERIDQTVFEGCGLE